jgi:hypothetical protein
MRKEAKYGENVQSLASKQGPCLTEDDMDLRVTICHIRCRDRLEPELTFSATSIDLTLVDYCHHCQNPH